MTSIGETVSFVAIAAVILGTALMSVLSRRTFHSVMFLGAVLVAMGALFILLGSSLVGIIQILVYVGGILTLFIFAVMFVTGDEEEEGEAPATSDYPMAGKAFVWAASAGLVVAALLGAKMVFDGTSGLFILFRLAAAVLVFAAVGLVLVGVYRARWVVKFGAMLSLVLFGVMAAVVGSVAAWAVDSGDGIAAANDIQAVVDSLFGPNVIGFEVLGILLTAIMIGALVIARPLDAQSDSERYSHPTAEQVAQSDHISNVKESLARTEAADLPAAARPATEVPE